MNRKTRRRADKLRKMAVGGNAQARVELDDLMAQEGARRLAAWAKLHKPNAIPRSSYSGGCSA